MRFKEFMKLHEDGSSQEQGLMVAKPCPNKKPSDGPSFKNNNAFGPVQKMKKMMKAT